MQQDAEMHFSYSLEKGLSDKERRAAKVLEKFRSQLDNRDFNAALRDFYEYRPQVEKSQLYEILDKMPKGGIHHIHTTASPPVDVYVELTHDPAVYYNNREGLFKIYPKGEVQRDDGYIRCTEYREFVKDPEEFNN